MIELHACLCKKYSDAKHVFGRKEHFGLGGFNLNLTWVEVASPAQNEKALGPKDASEAPREARRTPPTDPETSQGRPQKIQSLPNSIPRKRHKSDATMDLRLGRLRRFCAASWICPF